MEISNNGYPIFKGLQKPLEFMGIRGRFLIWIAGAIGVGFVGFLVCSFLIGKLVGINTRSYFSKRACIIKKSIRGYMSLQPFSLPQNN